MSPSYDRRSRLMASIHGSTHPARIAPPQWPVIVMAACAALALVSIAQGVLDVVLPAVTGEAPFRLLFRLTEMLGPGFFVTYIFVHNLGLACLVPGFGFVAARYERKRENRGLIGLILLGAVAMSLLTAIHYLVLARERFDLAFALPLFAVEGAAVLVLAAVAARELRGFVPTRTYAWSLVTPFRRIAPVLAWSALALLTLALVETFVVFGA